MFGKLTLSFGDRQLICTTRSKSIWNLLAYILYHRNTLIPADTLVSILRNAENNSNPAGALRTAIHRTRTLLSELSDDPDFPFILSKDGGYIWNPQIQVLTDAEQFDALLSGVYNNDAAEIDACMAALDLYEGKFLNLQSSEMWVIPIQTYYHNLYESLIDRLVPLLEKASRYADGVSVCRRALLLNPHSEKLHQHLMRFLLVLGQRDEVIRVYDNLSKLLLATFGILPDQESRSLYRAARHSITEQATLTPDAALDQLCERGDINSALLCDFDFFKLLYHAQARASVRTGLAIHTALLTLKPRNNRSVSQKSLALAMDNLEKHLRNALRKGDVITRCSSSQFIVMLSAANYENSCAVCERFTTAFTQKYPHSPFFLDFYVQPLVPSTRS